MLAALQAFSLECQFTIEVLDVDADEALTVQYDELVPVLFGSKNGAAAVQLCHYFLDVEKLKEFLENY